MKTIYTFTFALLLVFFLSDSSQARPLNIAWRTGHIVLWDKSALTGEVSYNWSVEIVSLRQADGRVRTYSANQVSGFGWFDDDQNKQRTFVALLRPLDKERTRQVFFEVCMDGPLTVVRRLGRPRGLFRHLFSHPAHSSDQPVLTKNLDLFDYYVFDAGRLLRLDRFYPDIYKPLMTTYHRELNEFVRVHNINERSLPGRLVLIDRFNTMVQQDTKTASNKVGSVVNE